MRLLWPALLLTLPGCLEFDLFPNEDDRGTGLFAVSVDGAPPGPSFADPSLTIHVEESIFEADGPDQRESIQFLVDHVFDAYADDADIAFQLDRGDYTNVFFAVSIRSDESHSIEFEGDRDGNRYRLRIEGVDQLDLAFDVGRLEIDDTTALGSLRFDPGAWLDAVGADASQQEDVEIDGNSPEYADLLRAVEETTTFSLLSGDTTDGDEDDDDGSDAETD